MRKRRKLLDFLPPQLLAPYTLSHLHCSFDARGLKSGETNRKVKSERERSSPKGCCAVANGSALSRSVRTRHSGSLGRDGLLGRNGRKMGSGEENCFDRVPIRFDRTDPERSLAMLGGEGSWDMTLTHV